MESGCQTPSYQTRVFQLNTLAGLSRGQYEGAMTTVEVKARGNFGVGVFNDLDGEMVLLDGQMYRGDPHGNLSVPDVGSLMPFAMVSFWQNQTPIRLNSSTVFQGLSEQLYGQFSPQVLGYAIRIEGRFARVHFGNVLKQKKPYPPMSQALKTQAAFEEEGVQGTLVGFWFGTDLKSVSGSGFHFHYISADKKRGGHVLDVAIDRATAQLMPISESWLQVAYPSP